MTAKVEPGRDEFVIFGRTGPEAEALQRVINQASGAELVELHDSWASIAFDKTSDYGASAFITVDSFDGKLMHAARVRLVRVAPAAVSIVLRLAGLEAQLRAGTVHGPPAAYVTEVLEELHPLVEAVAAVLEGRS